MARKACTTRSGLEHMLDDETAEPKALALSLLEDITGDFSDDQQIGSGGFAVVYKGILGDRAVAVKRLSDAYMHEKQFHREVQCLMQVKHKNVVRFLGYCADTQGSMEQYNGKLVMADVHQRLLCFEYISRGSLDKYITDAYREWETCYKIIKGVSEGLHYLRENRIVHLDLKPANILLDNNMTPKITDFGLSRCFEENQSRDITKTILGTIGYLAPELRAGGEIARSADLYSLGVIIIEILTGQKGYQAIGDVIQSWSGRLERSQRNTLCEQIQVCYEIALQCIDFNPRKRPASARDIINILHEMESVQKLRRSAIGILEVGILDACNLKVNEGRLSNPYCVAKYGEKWVRTPTLLNTAAPQWNEQYTWDVFDMSTVIAVAAFDDCHLSSHDGRDQQLGKVRIRLATLESDRTYTHYYPLRTLTPSSGLNETGELHLAIRFTCKSWPKLLVTYGKPLPHKMNAISTLQEDHLRFQAVQMVAKRLERAEPPLRREVVECILDSDFNMFSLRRSKANYYRIVTPLSDAYKWLDDICNWKNALATILAHVLFLLSVRYSELILPMVFLCMIMVAAWNYRRRPRNPSHIDMLLSPAELPPPDGLDEELDTLPPPYMDTQWYPDQVHPDELNEESATTSKPDGQLLKMRYDRLRFTAGKLQKLVGDLAMQGERAQSLLRWHDPRVTPMFITLSLLVAVLLYLTPFRVVAMVMGLYFLRPPWFRSRSNLLFNLYSRLPSNDVVMLDHAGKDFGPVYLIDW